MLQDNDFLSIFDEFDLDNDNLLTSDEFHKLLWYFETYYTLEEIGDIIKKFDINEDDKLSKPEYLKFMNFIQQSIVRQMESRLKNKFNQFDLDRDGYITVNEMYRVLTLSYPNISITAAEIIVSDADIDKDSRIDFEEFKKLDIH